MYSTHKRMKKTYQLKRNTKRLTNFQKLMLTYLNSQKKLVNKCLSISKICTCTVIDVNSGGFRSGAQNCKDVESESGVFLFAAKGKMNMFPKDTDVGAMNLSEQEEQDWIQAQDSERPVIGCDEHNVSVCNKVCIMSNVSNDIVEGLETVTESGKPFDQYDKGTFSLVFLTKNRAYVSKFTSENIMTIKEKFATDQAMDISEISDTEEVNLKESGVMLGLPKCQKESGQNGIEESLKFLSPIVSVSCSSTGLNYSTDAGSPGNSSLTSSDATVSSDSSVTMTTGRFGNIKRKRTKHDLFTLNISREKGEKIITDKNLSKLDDDDDDDDDNSKAYMSDKEDTAEDNEVSYYELRRKPKVDYLGTKISEHYVDSENKSHEDSIKIKALNATSGNSMKNFPVRLHSTFGGRKSLKMKRKLESKRELVESEDFVINVSSSADIAPLEKNTVFTDLESRKETIYSAGYTNVSPTMEHTVNKELLCVKNDATLKDTGSNRRKRRKFSSSAPSLFKEDIRNENLKTDSKGAKYMYDEIELCIGDRESTTEDSEGSAYNLRRRPKVDYCGTKISRYYIDSLNESNKKDNEQTSLHCNRGAVVAHSIYEQRMLERLNNSEDNGKRFNRFDIDDKCMNEKEILLAKREENFYSNLKEDNSSDSLSLTLYEKDTDENLTDIKSHVKMCDKVNVKNKNTNNKGQLLDRRQENPDLNLEERYSSDCLDHISQKDSNEKFTDNESLDSLLLENPFSLDFSSPDSVRRYNRNDIASEQGKDMSGNNSTETLPNGSLLKQIVSDLQSENSRDYSEKTDVSETTAEVFPPCRRNIIAETSERNPLYINFIEEKFVGTTTCMESDRYGPTELFPARRNQEQDSSERPIPDMKISDKFMNLDTSGDRVNIPVCEQNNVGTLHSRIISNENKHTHEHSIDRTVLDGQYLGANTHVEILQENDKCGDKLIAGCCYSKADEKVNSKVTPIEIDNKEPTDSIDTNGNYAESLHYFDTSSDMKHVDSVLGECIEHKYQNQTLVQTTLDKFFTVVKNVPSTLFADAQTEQKTQSADTLTEMKTHYSDGQTEKKALSADTRTEKKAQSADAQTEMETQSADAQTEQKTQSADAQTEMETQSADAQTEQKTQSADTQTEKKAQSADTRTEKKAQSADAQTEMETQTADTRTEKKAQSADAQTEMETQSADTRTEKKAQTADTRTEMETQSADAQTEQKTQSADTRTEKKAQSADAQTEMESQSADAQTEQKTQSADTQTEMESQSADAQTVKKTQTADTEKKAQSADAQTEMKTLSDDAQTEKKTLSDDAQTEKKTQSADTRSKKKTQSPDTHTEKKTQSADTQTEKKTQTADTVKKTQSADAQTEMESQSADAQTVKKTQSADTQTEKKTQTADTEKKAQSADAQTEMKTLSDDAQTEKKTQSADTRSKKKTQSPDTHTEKKTQSADTQTEKKTQSADAQTEKNGTEAVTSNLGPKTKKEKIFENYLHRTSQYRVKSVSAKSTERDVVTKNAFGVNEHNSYIDGSCKFTVEADSSFKESSSFQEVDCIIQNDKYSCGLESIELDNVDSSEAVEGGKDVEPDSSVPILEQGDTNNNFSEETLPEIEFMEVSDVEKTATSNTEVDKKQEKLKKERSMNEYHEKCKKADFSVGEVVWGRFGKAWWPALVVSGEIVKRATKKGYIWLYWLSDHKISQVKLLDVDPFQNKFNTRCKEKRKHNMQYGIEKALEICAYRANVDMGEFGSIEDWTKSDRGFLHIKAKRYRPDPEYPVPNYVLKDLKGMPDSVQLPVAPCNQNIPAKHLGSTGQDGVSTNIDPGSSGLINPVVHEWNAADQSYNDLDVDETDLVCVNEKICIACSTEVTDGYNHPLFEGKICGKCKETLKESFYAEDDDGCSMFCDVCGEGGDLYMCSNNDCGKAYCFSCVEKHTSRATMKKIEETKYWKCFLCTAYSRQSHGNLIPHKEWSLEVVKFFQTNRVSMCSDLQYLKNSGRRKLRVLSLFDGIGSGKVALDELGLDVDVYYASEINPDALVVANFHHCPTQLGDIWDLSPAKLEELCPIDLVLAGPPCNDLSIVNPDRKGFGGTGILVWRFVAVLKDIQMICKSTNHVFWLMENTASMLTEYRKVISKQFEMEPVVWDAKHFTGQRRARNFWGNIPGMFSAPRFCKQLEKDKKDLNFALISNCNRTARVSHTRTITSSSNSLSITNGVNNPVVSMNGEPDHIWVQELERLFGFPIHYTDVGQLTLERRRKLIGKAWSVPVIKHLLSPLKQYFKVKDK